MKLSKGRGIQFFRQPFFDRHREYAANIYKAGKEGFGNVIGFVNKGKGKKR